jgi:type I restriction enzyme, S subunit
LLITLVGAIGRTAVAPAELAGANTARAVGVVPLTKLANSNWVELWFRNPAKQTEMIGKAHEVARKTLNLEDVWSAGVAIPQGRAGPDLLRRA